ncbi:MAG: citramalate synthase [Syntrophales bacterium]|jgi:2-isopropylmalate synthase|nr:citramalate synthase [Syntrophales bacterium]MCK9528237.1 citramalate synthase [Syntrophales bacterium]MDX9922368.1 citramalate synthase [Syntrophales bacterium]
MKKSTGKKKRLDVVVYDTTLRDGTQGEQVSVTAEEKIKIARRLDDAGFHYVEGGWPGSNPKDMRFFKLAKRQKYKNIRLAAFGSTRKQGVRTEECPNVRALLEACTPVVTIFGKSWDLHATEILGVSLEENLAMIGETVAFLKSRKKEVVYDAEHFFDGYRHNRPYALETIIRALSSGADWIVLCDTNGGSMTWELVDMIEDVKKIVPPERLGIHVHNDCGLAVANSIAAVNAGVPMVQGTINGYGERCGNADLVTIIGNVHLKMGRHCIPESSLETLTALSLYVSDLVNVAPLNSRPYVGKSAFAHKGGVHVSAILKNPIAYEHTSPELVGNHRRVVVSDLSGKSNIEYKARELGISLEGSEGAGRKVVREIKKMENEGYQFDAADGSLALLIKKTLGEFKEPFELVSFHVIDQKNRRRSSSSQATIKVSVGKEQEITAAEGNGPVNALDNALRKALRKFYPQLDDVHLVDFKVRIIEGSDGTAAKVRVLLESRDRDDLWTTIGVSENIIEASWRALADSIQYKLSKDGGH